MGDGISLGSEVSLQECVWIDEHGSSLDWDFSVFVVSWIIDFCQTVCEAGLAKNAQILAEMSLQNGQMQLIPGDALGRDGHRIFQRLFAVM